MVRKWSYLSKIQLIDYTPASAITHSIYNFKVFKATTRFKKPNRGPLTYSVRRKYTRRRHRTNWVTMLYITRFWVSLFTRNKQFVRYYQSLGLVNMQSFATSTFLVNKQLPNLNTTSGFSTFSCSKRLLSYFLTQENKWVYQSPIPRTSSTGLLTLTPQDSEEVTNVNPGIVVYDGLLYPYHDMYTSSLRSISSCLTESQFELTKSYNLSYYRILIYLTLLNNNR